MTATEPLPRLSRWNRCLMAGYLLLAIFLCLVATGLGVALNNTTLTAVGLFGSLLATVTALFVAPTKW